MSIFEALAFAAIYFFGVMVGWTAKASEDLPPDAAPRQDNTRPGKDASRHG